MLEREQAVAERAARAAGEIVRGYFERSYTIREKGRDNPVTEADLEANECIRGILRDAFPEDGWLSEETRDSRQRLTCERVWIVDPLDGTKEFIQHVPELCVCIALVENGRATLGVSFNPIRDEMFSAARGQGTRCNGHPCRVTEVSDLGSATLLASRSELSRGEWERYRDDFRIEPTGSVAYKLALVAAGRGDATFSLTPKHEWDICSGAILIEEAGGIVRDRWGAALRFNRPDPWLPGLIASNAALFDAIQRLVGK